MNKKFAHRNQWTIKENRRVRLIDPRLAITRQTGWHKLSDGTMPIIWTGTVEPDNYNCAIYHNKPYDIAEIQEQVFYYDNTRPGWFSVYYIDTDARVDAFEQYVKLHHPWASWRNTSRDVGARRSVLHHEMTRRCNIDLTGEEILYHQGYYEKMKNKYEYCRSEQFAQAVGIPRWDLSVYKDVDTCDDDE